MRMMAMGMGTVALTVVASVLLILLSIVYFGVTLFIVKVASNFFYGPGLEANWAVLSASILSVGAIIAGALRR
jgi:hypothetical protein